ncbi:MAG: hypothetical protein IKZ09_03355 [Clostridia bacterium]|nr:hypothetical protein [Clostridia bacterium]
MNKKNRTLPLLLALLTIAAATTSCGGTDTVEAATEAGIDTASVTVETNERERIRENVPADADYNGYQFRIQSRDAEHHHKELSAEAENGETINDAVFRRNSAVEEKLNITVVPVYESEAPESNPLDMLRQNILAGDDYVDLALVHAIFGGQVAADGLFRNWYDLEYCDFTKPWWNKNVSDELTIDGQCYLAVGDLCISAIDYAWAMVYNKELAASYDIGDIYQTVIDGKWTVDTFATMLSQASADLNGDGKYDDQDRYGFTTHDNSAIVNWMFALGQKVTQMNSDGLPELVLNTERMVSIVEKVDGVLHDGHQTFICTDKYNSSKNISHDIAVATMFSEGKALFAAMRIYVIDNLRSMDANFGIIPFPKYDEAQATYNTHVDGHAPLMGVPVTVTETARTSVIIECLNAESYRTCVPAMYDIVLTEKFSRDEMSVKMLDLILDGRTQNFGYVYEGSTGMQWALTNLMKSNSTDFTSYYKQREKSAISYYEQIVEAHQNIE